MFNVNYKNIRTYFRTYFTPFSSVLLLNLNRQVFAGFINILKIFIFLGTMICVEKIS